MNEDYLTSPNNYMKNISKTAIAAAQSLSSLYVNSLSNQTLDSIKETSNIVVDSLKSQVSLNLDLQNLYLQNLDLKDSYIMESISILQKSMSEYLKESFYSRNSVFESLNSSIASFYNRSSFTDPAFISLNSALNDEFVKYRYKAKQSQDNRENFNSNELTEDTKDTEPRKSISKTTEELNSKVEKLDKGFFHGLITPFSTKEELGRHVSQEIIDVFLNIVMTYAITVGIADAELFAKAMYNSIANRLKH
ncbi:hypothetical protein LPICM17_650004 [Lactococcus piscium]|nr:hypothetical protein LPICM17_650004 [Lactococcus piscium]